MRTLLRHPFGGGVINAVYSEVNDGDLSSQAQDVEQNRQRLVPLPWTWLRQVHGSEVFIVETPGAEVGRQGDGLATATAGSLLSVQTADCAPVLFISEGGAIGIAHAGWKGLEAGILANTATAVRSLGDGEVSAILGPCIQACCYEFGSDNLQRLSTTFGQQICSVDSSGRPSLDLPAAVESALRSVDVKLTNTVGRCTEEDSFWSHRLRGQSQRMATCIWIES